MNYDMMPGSAATSIVETLGLNHFEADKIEMALSWLRVRERYAPYLPSHLLLRPHLHILLL
jgi:hypothetical protein